MVKETISKHYDPMLARSDAHALFLRYVNLIYQESNKFFTAINRNGLRVPASMEELEKFHRAILPINEKYMALVEDMGMSPKRFRELYQVFIP